MDTFSIASWLHRKIIDIAGMCYRIDENTQQMNKEMYSQVPFGITSLPPRNLTFELAKAHIEKEFVIWEKHNACNHPDLTGTERKRIFTYQYFKKIFLNYVNIPVNEQGKKQSHFMAYVLAGSETKKKFTKKEIKLAEKHIEKVKEDMGGDEYWQKLFD